MNANALAAAIAAHVFLGQVYPSGKVYLVTFPMNDESQSEDDYVKNYRWPQSVTYQGLSGGKPLPGRFVGVMHDSSRVIGPNVFQLESAHIPGMEGMDDRHEGCTKSFYKPKNPQYRYEGEDFFEQMSDNCNPNEGTGIFEGTPGEVSFSVAAFDKDSQLSDVQYLKGKPRPMTKAEAAEVAREKAENAKQTDCTTNPTYLDEAKSFFSAKAGGGLSVLLSRYTTAGCAGHLGDVYILDVLKGGAPVKTYTLGRRKGVL